MMKILPLCAVFVAIAVSAATAQNSARRVYDNFDTRFGVNVYVPPPPPELVQPVAKKDGKSNTSKIQLTAINRNVSEPSMRMGTGRTLGSFSTGDARVDSFILDSTTRYNVDPLLVYSTMSQESSFKPLAMSYKGARGLMQLMPATAARFGVTNIFDPKQNIEGGVKYLRWLLDTFNGDVRLALAGYNAGEGAVMKYGYSIPPYAETQNYVARITARYETIRNPNYVRSVLRPNAVAPVQKNGKPAKPEPPSPIYVATTMVTKLTNGKIQLTNQ